MQSLQRFLDAQAPVYETVLAELRAGRKTSHWMWFVFPQLRGLGHSTMAQHYGLAGRAEALAYAQHPVLGARLAQCMALLLAHRGRSADDILGEVDALKLRSCATLFAEAAPELPGSREVLAAFFRERPDPRTLELLGP
ncbi:DUF1810 domain-containing protein [Silanimonas sp.]|jgi:uncharacterized protein (DUF1810 family)|uniref:DUF1810 domain-containing protein n=1 Tax=Silanimonas sp. TaxID=1929290 RepID=UPI0022C48A2B|nr:DUF1810 domain-containing protein [Silanimonas sp.]MCZ8167304.1 DUF1810 domain-containing protein [Silanimonas sp.]